MDTNIFHEQNSWGNDFLLEEFNKKYKAEVYKLEKEVKKANSMYKKAMKKFIVTHIYSKNNFKGVYKDTSQYLYDSYSGTRGSEFLDDVMIYESIIEDHVLYLENNGFDD